MLCIRILGWNTHRYPLGTMAKVTALLGWNDLRGTLLDYSRILASLSANIGSILAEATRLPGCRALKVPLLRISVLVVERVADRVELSDF